MEITVSYQCVICSKEFYNRTPDLYNDDCELFCSIHCCETYYHDKYQYIDCEDNEENLQEECDDSDNEEDNPEKICEACKEEFIPKNIFQKYCSKFCEDSEEENIGYALIKQFSTLYENK